MALFKPGTRGWQILTLAIVAVPWLLRDQLATTLDDQNAMAAEVLNEYEQEASRQEIDRVQRETMERIIKLEKATAPAGAASAAEADLKEHVDAVKEDGASLVKAADAFTARLDKLSLADADRERLKALATQAKAAGSALAQYDGSEAQEPMLDAYDKSAEAFEKGYVELYALADKASDETAKWAGWARLAAWILTALGGLMVTGFKPANVLDEMTGRPTA